MTRQTLQRDEVEAMARAGLWAGRSDVFYDGVDLVFPEDLEHSVRAFMSGPMAAAVTAQRQAALVAYAADKRWRVQNAGTALPPPFTGTVQTDDGTRATIAQTLQSIDLGIVNEPVVWKLPSGFVSLSRSDLVAVARLIGQHVQACFDMEADVGASIQSGAITTTAAIEAAGWPANT
jgi:hypothetical protein